MQTTFNIPVITKLTKTRYVKRTNVIKSSNFEMDLDTLKAYSYDWWLFCTTVNGKVIFNNTRYSSTTDKHQGKAWRVLNYQADLTLNHTTTSLANLSLALENEIKGAKLEIKSLIKTIKKPRTHRAKNQERREAVTKLLKHVKNVQSIKEEL